MSVSSKDLTPEIQWKCFHDSYRIEPNRFRCQWNSDSDAYRWKKAYRAPLDLASSSMLALSLGGHLGHDDLDFSWAIRSVVLQGQPRVVAVVDFPPGAYIGRIPGRICFPSADSERPVPSISSLDADGKLAKIPGPRRSGLHLKVSRDLSNAPVSSAILIDDEADANVMGAWEIYREGNCAWPLWRVCALVCRPISAFDTIRILET